MPEGKTKSITDKLNSLGQVQVIDALAAWASRYKLPFAVYRLPGQKHFCFLAGTTARTIAEDGLAEAGAGFLFSPYAGEHYFIDQGVFYSAADNRLIISPNWPQYIPTDSLNEDNGRWQPYNSGNSITETTAAEYIDYVNKCIAEIRQSELIKAVPSRTKLVSLPAGQSLSRLFHKLCQVYANAFVSILSVPEFGTWMGATPESLIEVDSKGIFKTMSLAGTQPYTSSQPLHTLPWTQKEIEEQAMVSRYIINRFKEIRLREFEEVGPRTVSAGNLAHLCSTFTVDTKATNFPDLGPVMLKLLHPTSAVCGMPKPQAQALLSGLEKHQRKLYSGYLGPVNMAAGSYIYVNLRCMEVLQDKAVLYAGAGVTAYSVAADEWQETELKCNTLLNVIRQ